MASPIDPRLWALIKQYAPRLRIDPYAAAAVSLMEGGGRFGEVGDNGTSFGPWQLHVGGALPPGRNAAWANSPDGVYYVLQQMARSGAAGLHGASAIRAMVSRFERPAAPAPEIAGAIQRYQQFGGRPMPSTPFHGGHGATGWSPVQHAMDVAAGLLAGLSPGSNLQRTELGATTPAQALQALFPGTASSPPPTVINPVNADHSQSRTDDALAATQHVRAGLLPTPPQYG